jgi:hypothetical protein
MYLVKKLEQLKFNHKINFISDILHVRAIYSFICKLFYSLDDNLYKNLVNQFTGKDLLFDSNNEENYASFIDLKAFIELGIGAIDYADCINSYNVLYKYNNFLLTSELELKFFNMCQICSIHYDRALFKTEIKSAFHAILYTLIYIYSELQDRFKDFVKLNIHIFKLIIENTNKVDNHYKRIKIYSEVFHELIDLHRSDSIYGDLTKIMASDKELEYKLITEDICKLFITIIEMRLVQTYYDTKSDSYDEEIKQLAEIVGQFKNTINLTVMKTNIINLQKNLIITFANLFDIIKSELNADLLETLRHSIEYISKIMHSIGSTHSLQFEPRAMIAIPNAHASPNFNFKDMIKDFHRLSGADAGAFFNVFLSNNRLYFKYLRSTNIFNENYLSETETIYNKYIAWLKIINETSHSSSSGAKKESAEE